MFFFFYILDQRAKICPVSGVAHWGERFGGNHLRGILACSLFFLHFLNINLLQEQIRIQNPNSDSGRPKLKKTGSGIQCFFYSSGIRDGKNLDLRYGTRDKHPGSYFRALSNNLLNKNTSILCELRNADLDPGSGDPVPFWPLIREGKIRTESRLNIRDPQHWRK